MAFDLVIFDCDGVLVDSEIIATRVEAERFTRAGYPLSPRDVAVRFAGKTEPDIIAEIERETGKRFPETFFHENEQAIDEALAQEIRIVQGARQTVEEVRVARCICSNSTGKRLEVTLSLTGLRDLFGDTVYSARDLENVLPKPAPDVFLHACRQMGVAPDRTIVLEDSTTGVAAASEAGATVIGFCGASHSWDGHAEALIGAGADLTVNSHEEAQRKLREMLAC